MGVNIPDATPAADPSHGSVGAVEKLLQEARNPAPAGKPEPTDTQEGTPAAETADVQGTEQEDPQQAFYKTKVRIREGVEPTVEELKDAYRTKSEYDEREAKLNRDAAEWRADQLAHERELNQILSAIDPQSVRPELLDAWKRQQEDFKSREREKMLRHIPDWGDARKETADRAEITELIKAYGFAEKDIENVTDSRLMRLVRDFSKLRAKDAERAKAERPEPRKGIEPRKAPPASEAQELGQLKARITKRQIRPEQGVYEILKKAGKL